MTEQEKMLAGKIYDPSDETLLAIRTKAHKLCQTYNQTADTEEEAREQMMRDLIPDCAKGVYLQGPIYFDYGEFTTIGENTFANFNFTVLDTCPVHIGNPQQHHYRYCGCGNRGCCAGAAGHGVWRYHSPADRRVNRLLSGGNYG